MEKSDLSTKRRRKQFIKTADFLRGNVEKLVNIKVGYWRKITVVAVDERAGSLKYTSEVFKEPVRMEIRHIDDYM